MSNATTSPPAPAASSPPAPSSSPPTSPPPQSPPPSSPPPSPTQSPPPSSPPPSQPHSPPPAAKSPPPKSSSPPPKSNPSPPPPQSSSTSPPPSQGPPASGSPPPAPPHQSTPPPTTGTPPSSSQGSTPPPPNSQSPPSGQFTPPPVSDGEVSSPPTQTLSPPPISPPVDNASPATPSNSTPSNRTSPTSSSTSKTTPASSSSSQSPSSPPPATPTIDVALYAGGAVAGVLLIAFFALFFVARRRKKRRSTVFATQYMPPNSFSPKSEGYYLHNSGPADTFYSQPQQSPQGTSGNSYGSQRGNMYYQGTPNSDCGIGGAKSWFSYEEVMEMTNGFSRQNILGEGGFGCVYKGWLPDGKVVAVKQLKKGSGQGEREFRAEVEIISRVHHRYLVSLVGYCIAENQRLLIYEFVPNQTLEHHLHGKGMPVLEWPKRMKIALGAARGLAYLHEDCHPKIIHRDIKSANILLDDAFEAQVADFGLAKLTDDTNTHVSTRVMGTFGYMAPEYASSGKLTDRSDVFSFGVMLLELVTGRKPVDPTQPLGDESLVEWARPHLVHALDTGDFGELVDARLEKRFVESEMFRMIEAAAACVRHSAPKRPRMMQVARALDCESETSDLSNGVKYGQSTVYESGQYSQDITRFKRMAFGSGDSKEFDMYSGEYTSREISSGLTNSWKFGDTSSGFPSGESETQAMNAHHGDGGRRFR